MHVSRFVCILGFIAITAAGQQPESTVPYRIGNGVSAPSVLSKVEPEYSEEARRAGLEGTVALQLVVDGQGHPQNVKVLRSLGMGLDEKAIEAVKQWRFNPGMKDGKGVPVLATIEVNFRLLHDPTEIQKALHAFAGTTSQAPATPIYRPPVEVETKYGNIIFNGIKFWDYLTAHSDSPPPPGSKIIPVFRAEVDNQTGTEWHVPVFQITFHCPGEASVRKYTEALGTVKIGRSSVLDWIPGFPSWDAPCNAEAVSMTLIGGDNDRDRSARLEQASRELEAAKLADKQRQDEEERAEAAAEKRRLAARTAAEAKAIAKQEADQRARVAYLAQFPTLENGAEAIFIGSDRKCSEQFVQAMSMDGIEKRKRIADLVSYGCGFVDSRGVRVKRVRNEGAYCQVSPIEGKHQTESGWVPCSWVR